MPEFVRKESGRRRRALPRTRGFRVAIAITVSLTLVAGLTIMASSGTPDTDLDQKADRETLIAIQSLNPNTPSKEYVYAGGRLLATVEPTVNNAQFISMQYFEPCGGGSWLNVTASSFGDTSQNYLVKVTMKNTGSDEWPLGGDYFLGSQGPPNNETWGIGKNRIAVPISVPPNDTVDFVFTVKRPVAGSNFQWQMVQGPVSSGVFFGQMTPVLLIPSGAWLCSSQPAFLATFVSQSVPPEMLTGQTYNVSITMYNAGLKPWDENGCNLGSQIPQDNTIWGLNRVALPSPIDPGQNVTFAFTVTAPTTPGEYNFQWMMVLDSESPPQWFGYLTPTTYVKVLTP